MCNGSKYYCIVYTPLLDWFTDVTLHCETSNQMLVLGLGIRNYGTGFVLFHCTDRQMSDVQGFVYRNK